MHRSVAWCWCCRHMLANSATSTLCRTRTISIIHLNVSRARGLWCVIIATWWRCGGAYARGCAKRCQFHCTVRSERGGGVLGKLVLHNLIHRQRACVRVQSSRSRRHHHHHHIFITIFKETHVTNETLQPTPILPYTFELSVPVSCVRLAQTVIIKRAVAAVAQNPH